MKVSNPKNGFKFALGAVAFVSTAALFSAAPAYAGYWSLTGTPTGGYNNGGSISASYGESSVSWYDLGVFASSGSFTYTGTVQWVGGGTQPTSFTLTETAGVGDTTEYSYGTGTANDGLGDPAVTKNISTFPGGETEISSSGTHTTVIHMSPGEKYTYTRYLTGSISSAPYYDIYTDYSASVQ